MSQFLQNGKSYIENDADGFATGSLWKYNGIVNNQHEFQSLEFDCDDEFKEFSLNVSDDDFKRWFTFNS